MYSRPYPTSAYAGLLPRGGAYLIDCTLAVGIIVATQFLLFIPVRNALGIGDDWFRSGVNMALYSLLTVSLPIWLYFALSEQSVWQATVGKRMLRLRVVDVVGGARMSVPQSLLRTIVKLLPWEVAHLTNYLPEPIWYAQDPDFRIGFVFVGLLMGVHIATVGLHAKKQGPHDLIAGTAILGAAKTRP